MNASSQLAARFREVVLNGTWVANTNLKAQLSDLTWTQATAQIASFNTVAVLAQHLHYYIAGMLAVFEGDPLTIRDRFSFDFPPVQSEADWQRILETLWRDAEAFALCVERMNDADLQAKFAGLDYGSVARNVDAMIEHAYYHLGQIVLLKKWTQANG